MMPPGTILASGDNTTNENDTSATWKTNNMTPSGTPTATAKTISITPTITPTATSKADSKTPPKTIVALGDSITSGLGGTVTYEQYLAKLMPATAIITKGVIGDTTGGMLGRFQADGIANAPQYLIILGGTNDVNINIAVDTTTANLQSMYTRASQYGIIPVLCTILPVSSYNTVQKNNIVKLNAWISSYASDHNLPFVDLYGTMQDLSTPGNLNPAYDGGDGLHPNNAGYQRIANTIYNAVFA